MNLEELRTVQSEERRADSLQHLRPSFYREVGEYVADLAAERDRVAADADDPFASPEVRRLTDEIETARDVVEAIYERRMGKLVKQASLAAAGMPADDAGLTAEEADLFEDLVERIRTNKATVLDALDGEATDDGGETAVGAESTSAGAADAASTDPDAPPIPPDEPPVGAGAGADAAASGDAGASGVSAADVMGGTGPDDGADPADGRPASPSRADPASAAGEGEAAEGPHEDGTDAEPPADDPADPGPEVERVTVRITRDVGSILGIDDREYTLAADDVVTLPEPNAAPLVERDAAEPLE